MSLETFIFGVGSLFVAVLVIGLLTGKRPSFRTPNLKNWLAHKR